MPQITGANRGIEGDGDGGDDSVNFGFSDPTIANMTIIGNDFDGEDDAEGVLLRDQTAAKLYTLSSLVLLNGRTLSLITTIRQTNLTDPDSNS